MPTYEYVCDACGHAFELFQGIKEPVKRKCPKCSALKLRRLLGTGAAVIFKGGGFYETDYRSESYKKGADAEKKAAEPKAEASDKGEATSKSDSASPGKGDSKSPPSDHGESKLKARSSATHGRRSTSGKTPAKKSSRKKR